MAKKSNVYKDANGWYFKASLGFDQITGKRRTKTKRGFKTRGEAEVGYMQFMIDWKTSQEETAIQAKNSMIFETFKNSVFLPWYKSQVKPNTYNRRVGYLKERFHCFDKKLMSDITKMDVQLFQNELVIDGLSGRYINLLFSLGGMMWDRAKIFELVKDNPFRDIGRVRVETKRIRFWTLEEFRTFEKMVFPHELKEKVSHQANLTFAEYSGFFYYLFFRFLFFSGLRFGESATLMWENVDEQTGLIKVKYTIGNIAKKKTEQYFSTPKTKSSERELYIDNRTRELLIIWKRYQQKVGNIQLVFSHDDTFLDAGWIWKKFRLWQKKYHLKEISVHDLRHSHASLLVYLGENPKMIQMRLGHSNIEMTLGTYSHLYPNQDLELISRLDEINNE